MMTLASVTASVINEEVKCSGKAAKSAKLAGWISAKAKGEYEMTTHKIGCCGTPSSLIYACSGASNVGQLTHALAVRASQEGICAMSCLAGIGAHLPGFVGDARDCDRVIVLDGCDKQCAKKVFEHIHQEPDIYIELTKQDFTKTPGATVSDSDVTRALAILKKSVEDNPTG